MALWCDTGWELEFHIHLICLHHFPMYNGLKQCENSGNIGVLVSVRAYVCVRACVHGLFLIQPHLSILWHAMAVGHSGTVVRIWDC